MKKVFTILLAVVACVGTIRAEIYSGTFGIYGNNLTWSLNTEDSTLTITGTGKMSISWYSAAYVPWYNYNSYIKYVSLSEGLTDIGKYAFSGCANLTSIEIPNTVTSIGFYAFDGCVGLTSIDIPNSVISIGFNAFENCNSMTSVTIGNNVANIGEQAFYGCNSLSFLSIGNNVTNIGKNAFSNCSSLTSIELPNSITNIEEQAFSGCSSLTSIMIPKSVTNIGKSAFTGCHNLILVTINSDAIVSATYNSSNTIANIFGYQVKEYIIGDDVTSIGDYIFYNLSNINSITIGNNVSSIGESAFRYCGGLTSVEIPNSVICINNLAFANCIGLGSVSIGNSVTSIGSYAFNGCAILTSIEIPNSVTSIGSFAFEKCTSLTSIEISNSVTSIGNGTFSNCSGLTEITIPDSVTSIGEWAFSGCTSLTTIIWNAQNCNSISQYGYDSPFNSVCNQITSFIFGDKVKTIPAYLCYRMRSLMSIEIPNSVTNIGYNAFYYCDSLVSINVSTSNANYCSVDGVLFNKEQTELIQYPAGKLDAEYTIPNSVTSIGKNAFLNCNSLTSMEISNNVNNIGDAAFFNCHGLTSVMIGNSVVVIGMDAFGLCDSLTSVSIGSNVYSIKESAFFNCSSLNVITNYATTPQNIANGVFEGVNKSTCKLFVPKNSISLYQNAEVWREFFNISATSDVTAIDDIKPCSHSQKIIRDNKLLIEKNGKIYTIIGEKVK